MAEGEELEFEQAMSRLEEIVRLLDGGKKSLNDSLVLFEEGIKLARECSQRLDDAKGRIEALAKDAGTCEPLEI